MKAGGRKCRHRDQWLLMLFSILPDGHAVRQAPAMESGTFSAAPHNSHHFVKPVFPALAMQMIILTKHNSIEAYTP
jgi:hypothetical protein